MGLHSPETRMMTSAGPLLGCGHRLYRVSRQMNLDTVECAVCGRASLSVDMSLLSSATEEACSEAIEAIQGRMKELADIASTSRDRARLAEVNVELTHLSWRQPSIIRTRNKLQLAA